MYGDFIIVMICLYFTCTIQQTILMNHQKFTFQYYGERLNPNLYADGKVCLSLLGTWEGKNSCEMQNPDSSNLQQVLVFMLGLVLVSEESNSDELGLFQQPSVGFLRTLVVRLRKLKDALQTIQK